MRIDPERGSGRTWRLVDDARAGDAIVVVHGHGRDQVRSFLHRQGRPVDELRVIELADRAAAEQLRAVDPDRRVYVDHAAAELARFDACARCTLEEVEVMATARFGGVHYYPVAEPCDTGSPGSPHGRKPRGPAIEGALNG